MRTLLLVVLRPLSCLGCPNFGMLKGRGQGCLSDAPQLLCRLEPAGGEVGHTHYKSLQNKIGRLLHTYEAITSPPSSFFFLCTCLHKTPPPHHTRYTLDPVSSSVHPTTARHVGSAKCLEDPLEGSRCGQHRQDRGELGCARGQEQHCC